MGTKLYYTVKTQANHHLTILVFPSSNKDKMKCESPITLKFLDIVIFTWRVLSNQHTTHKNKTFSNLCLCKESRSYTKSFHYPPRMQHLPKLLPSNDILPKK